MSDSGSTTLADFSDGGGDDRDVEAEARAVAGSDTPRTDSVVDADDWLPDADGTVELSVIQVDYTIEGSGDDEKPIVHVFGRTRDNDLEHVLVHGFEPYFYAPTDSLDAPPEEQYDSLVDSRETDENGDSFESIRGEKLTKIIGRTPRDVGNVRDEFDHYEADILFPNRFLIDKDIQSGIRLPERRDEDGDLHFHDQLDTLEAVEVEADPRVHYFDIEVDDRSGFPEEGEEPIICLTTFDSYDEEYIAWLADAPDGDAEAPAALPDYEPIEEIDLDVRSFDDERAMLAAYLDYLDETDGDIISGWNADDFDVPYLIDRLDELNGPHEYDLDSDRLSRVNEVWRSDWGGPTVKGRVVFDLLYAYKRTQRTELESYRLDAVGEVELGVGKERYAGDIGDLWENDPERLLEYNVRDVELCVELDRKQDIVSFWEEVASFVGCKLEDATTPGDAVDMYVLHKAYGRFALPSKGKQESEDFEGGAVFEPITGVKENVTVLDLKSLYPMAMTTINASPETQADPEDYESREEFEAETYTAPTGTHFRKEPDGIIREIIDETLDEREEKKALRDEHDPETVEYERFNRQQQAVKVIMNSLYGVSGWDRFRLYDKKAAAAITATGRDVIDYTQEQAKEMGHNVAYGDSVTGDRPIVVRDPNGNIRIRPIEELFERATPKPDDGILVTADGGPVASVESPKDHAALEEWDALSVNENGKAEWKSIEGVIRHETDKQVVKLQHKFGESVTTRDHSYVVEDGDELVEATPEDVEAPLRVPGVPEVEAVEEIDVYEVLKGYEREYEDGRGTGGTTTKTKRVHANDECVWFGHEHHHGLDKTITVKRYIDLDGEGGEALLRLLGAYVPEGSASTVETASGKFGASIAESRREWLRQLREDYHRLFDGTTANIIASDTNGERTIEYDTASGDSSVTYDDGTQKLQMMNELAAVFFREFAGQTSRGKRVPSFVFHLPEEKQDVFLQMLVEGDGSREFPRYSEEYAEQNFDFETVSRELAAGLSTLLTQRGQNHSLKYRDSKDSYTIRTCDYYRSGREPVRTEVEHDGYVYDLSVADNENFVDAVGGVVLHNTDSVMLELGGDIDKEEAIEQSFEIEEHINEAYDDFAREELNADHHRFQIEFEKLYRRFFQAGKKKRYAGHIVWKEGKHVDDIDITGFEYKRSDIAPITKEVQKRVIDMIVHGEDLEDVKEYVHDVIEDYQAGNVNLDDVGIPGGIGKRLDAYDTDTAQVRGAKYANLMLGTNFQRGSKPKRLYLEGVHPDFWQRMENERGFDPSGNSKEDRLYREFKKDPDVICFEFSDEVPEEFEVDWPKMLDKTLQGPIERILEALDISWDEVKSGQEQTGLGSFV
ncbi:DNA polymerase domain-containing protein [Halorussus pelagicus]|uniref:DNA polymerase domain-containing protein n=1 Tax=Halorussus pelagicus TaxID=2505977 RepID=UPI000FFC4719|nr:DNA polymerase domain-containing protein [Halorussus pelagicus]